MVMRRSVRATASQPATAVGKSWPDRTEPQPGPGGSPAHAQALIFQPEASLRRAKAIREGSETALPPCLY